ncbi:MAG: hypothetical protein LC769_09005 [Chloroflexi bacterium]|nr:hypothetical protein [Chloroflexota bacterium]
MDGGDVKEHARRLPHASSSTPAARRHGQDLGRASRRAWPPHNRGGRALPHVDSSEWNDGLDASWEKG